MEKKKKIIAGVDISRRGFWPTLIFFSGLVLAYGVFALESILFLLPGNTKVKTRRLFAGKLDQYQPGETQLFYDLEGTPIIVRRDGSTLRAFSSVCPHLGCRVTWEEEEKRFFCPCHGGAFSENGEAILGPPKDAKQNLFEVPVQVEKLSGMVYIEVKDPGKRGRG